MSDAYSMYSKVSNRIKNERERLLATTNRDFKYLTDEIIGRNTGNIPDIEKRYRRALKDGKPSAFYKQYDQDLRKLIEPDLIPLFYYEIDRVNLYQYDDSIYRRNFRSTEYLTYIKIINKILLQFINFSLLKVDMNDYLLENITEEMKAYKNIQYYAVGHPYVIAAMIDSGNEQIRKTIEEVVLGSGGNVSVDLIRGIFLSSDAEMYKLMEKLLLAARLQEGLRQAICESMDFGTVEAFDYMFKVILDNDLLRFSSVQRAMEMTTGILSNEEKGGDRLTKKHAELARRYLNDESEREKAFTSDDHMEIFMGLWAIGTRSIEDASKKAEGLVFNGDREQSLTAMFFLAHFCYDTKIFMRILKEKKDELDIVTLAMTRFLRNSSQAVSSVLMKPGGKYRDYITNRVFADPEYFFDNKDEAKAAYFILKNIMAQIPNKKIEYKGLVFPWYDVELTKTDCITRMVYCASASMDKTLTLEVAKDITLVDKWARENALAILLNEPENKEEYEILTKEIGDAEERTRDRANKMLMHELKRDTSYLDPEIAAKEGKLPAVCYGILEDLLRLKRSDLRQNVINLLLTQDTEDKVRLFERLLSDKSEEKRTAALDMILLMKKEDSPVFYLSTEIVKQISSPTTQEQVLIDEIMGSDGNTSAGIEEGYGIYDPGASYSPVFDQAFLNECNEAWNNVFPNKKIGRKFLAPKKKFDDMKILQALDDLIEKNKDLEYERWGTKKLLGNGIFVLHSDIANTVPFPELWNKFYDEWIKTPEELVRVGYLIARAGDAARLNSISGFKMFCNSYVEEYFGPEFPAEELPFKHKSDFGALMIYLSEKYSTRELKSKIGCAVAYHIANSKDAMLFTFTKKDITEKIYGSLDKDVYIRTPLMDNGFKYFINAMIKDSKSFPVKYALVRKFDGDYLKDDSFYRNYSYSNKNSSGNKLNVPDIGEYIAACADGLISDDFVYKRIFDGFEKEALQQLSSVILFIREKNDIKSTRVRRFGPGVNRNVAEFLGRKNIFETIDPENLSEKEKKILEKAEECYEKVISVCVGKELRRGDTPTEFSEFMTSVGRIYGLNYFVSILKAFGKSSFSRSQYLSYGRLTSKEDVLSHLLGVCVPDSRDGDVKEQAAKLKDMIKGTDIKEKRLIEAALFSPEWIDIIGELLGFEGFRSGCYYFMAHMNERFDEKRKASIAKYSPISPEEFNAGAFDKTWFDEVYALLGAKRFNEIYDAAKYISDGAKHSRARKYADAATGKMDAQKTKEEIINKRNKDLLMAYAIIDGNGEEIRDRYCYIRQFIKESKKFGAQRRASEKLAGETAIKNMATAQGYPDETRFILKMENDIATGLASFWEMQKIGEVEMCLVVRSGKVDIKVVKGGKELKSIPAALKKNELVLDLQEAKKTFTEQYRRTRIMLEEAMENKTAFKTAEIDAIRANPVLVDMIDSLIFESDGQFGLWKDLNAKKDGDVFVSHPYTLFKAGVWKEMQALIFDNEIAQPFKQAFRELYVKTDEEKDCYDSRRYAGNQIQPQRTVGVLKNRRWIADVEDGLQKVYYKENIIATIYALADWFSPSDVEAPTLEWVAFLDRKTGQPIQIKDVPDILFSEVMRDVDLAVSVAHAGEVDPEMSHSTVEMRRAIAEFTCKSFKLKNVTFTDSHALIKGERGSYTVHLGSGVIHLEGGLMINVLPVHSQKRGRIFLPFVDDDPKTAEIISKILLFAEDKKIKDPFILNQIV